MQIVLGEERRSSLCGGVVEVDPAFVVPHGGGAGFPCNMPMQFTILQNIKIYQKLKVEFFKVKHGTPSMGVKMSAINNNL